MTHQNQVYQQFCGTPKISFLYTSRLLSANKNGYYLALFIYNPRQERENLGKKLVIFTKMWHRTGGWEWFSKTCIETIWLEKVNTKTTGSLTSKLSFCITRVRWGRPKKITHSTCKIGELLSCQLVSFSSH